MTGSKSNSQNESATLDEIFSCLSDPVRRRILTMLADENSRDEDEFESTRFEPDEAEREVFRLAVHHRHLPRLADAEFIEWDRDSDTVTRGSNFEYVRPLIALLDDHRDELPTDWP